MGLLDDAIREHLDLKRRRGADPSEIAREENDALGPVRREAEEEPLDAGSFADEAPPVFEDEPEPAPAAPPEPSFYDDRPVVSEPPVTHERPYAEREDETATPPHGDPLAHQQTREFSSTELDDALGHEDDVAPAAPQDEAPDEDEDVLEETPDFLQETPEHDRLWFEQKPPKDFDF